VNVSSSTFINVQSPGVIFVRSHIINW